jgi:hypothetical protein
MTCYERETSLTQHRLNLSQSIMMSISQEVSVMVISSENNHFMTYWASTQAPNSLLEDLSVLN